MFKQRLIVAGVAGALGLMVGAGAWAGPVSNKAIEVVGVGAAADPLIAVEANRGAIVDRIAVEHADVLATMGAGANAAFRAALAGLRADQLLAASLVGTVAEVNAIIVGQGGDGTQLQRFVALAPVATTGTLPSAQAYLVRNADTLTIVRSADLAAAGGQVVGYFVPTATTTAVTTSGGPIGQNDGTGSGPNSWIGYTAGSNVASGTGSAVAAGTFNAATNTNAAVFAGQSNQANGISSLVIGGFDNRATAIDSLVGAGAGHRATGARAVIVGGGYNLASGQWSAIVGGGRDGTASTAAGTNALDHIASGNYSFIGGGQGNRATGIYSTIGGGYRSIASGSYSTVAGGDFFNRGQVASGNYSFVGGGADNQASGLVSTIVGGDTNTTGPSSNTAFIGGGSFNTANGYRATIVGGDTNQASGQYSAIPGGANNIASGDGSVAMGRNALTQTSTPTPHDGAFVYSDGSSGNFRSTASNTFNVLATGGVLLATAATNAAGEAAPSRGAFLGTDGMLYMAPGNTCGNYGPKIGIDACNLRIIGDQSGTMYFRTNGSFAWYAGGTHSDVGLDPGGGSVLASLQTGASATVVTGTFRAQVVTATSDRNQKTAFAPVDAKAVLAKVNALPITTWSFKNEADAGVRHIGPMSQDFKQVFEVGADERSITTVDAGGVALAAIQGLSAELKERDATIAAQAARIEALQRQVTELVAAQDDVKVMKAALAELVRERAAVGVQVRLPLSH